MSDRKLTEAELQQKDGELVSRALADSGRAAGADAFNRYTGRHNQLVAEHERLNDVAAESAKALADAHLEIESLKDQLERQKSEQLEEAEHADRMAIEASAGQGLPLTPSDILDNLAPVPTEPAP